MAGRAGRSGRGKVLAAWAGGLALGVLHMGPFGAPDARLLAGWLPVELAWRLGWMAIAWLYLLWFCAALWRPVDEPQGAREDPG